MGRREDSDHDAKERLLGDTPLQTVESDRDPVDK